MLLTRYINEGCQPFSDAAHLLVGFLAAEYDIVVYVFEWYIAVLCFNSTLHDGSSFVTGARSGGYCDDEGKH